MGDIVINSAVRSNLQTLQSTAKLMAQTLYLKKRSRNLKRQTVTVIIEVSYFIVFECL